MLIERIEQIGYGADQSAIYELTRDNRISPLFLDHIQFLGADPEYATNEFYVECETQTGAKINFTVRKANFDHTQVYKLEFGVWIKKLLIRRSDPDMQALIKYKTVQSDDIQHLKIDSKKIEFFKV